MADILVVDDEDALRRLIAHILRAAGHTVREAADAGKALAYFDQRVPTLFITDIVLPEREGIETILELRHEMPDIPILAISGGGERLDPRLAKGPGATASLAKPFTADELLGAVARLLAGQTG